MKLIMTFVTLLNLGLASVWVHLENYGIATFMLGVSLFAMLVLTQED